jgi:hypothetical protein
MQMQISNAIGYAKFFSHSYDVVIRVYDSAGNMIALGAGIQSPLTLQRAYLGDGAAVAAGAGAFCGVEVLFPIFFDRLRTLAPFLRWVFGITIILSVMVCSYGVEILLGSGPVPVITPALPSPRPLPAVLPVVPVPVICPFASPQMKDPAQTPTKMICESLVKFMWFRLSRARVNISAITK